MKNLLFLVFVLSISVAHAQQPNLQLKAYFGGHTGIFNEKRDAFDKELVAGYQGGFSLRVSKGRAFLEPSFSFLRTYIELSDTVINEFVDLGVSDPEVRYNSFEFPVVIGFKFVETPLYKWYVATGMSMNISIKSKIMDGKSTVANFKARDIGIRNPRFSMRAGTGMDIAFFNIDLYYNLGLNSATRTSYRTQTHTFEINFGFLF